MRLVAPVPARVPSVLLRKGKAGSFLIGPWPAPGGASSQSSMFDCQPKSGEANCGMAFADSARAVPATSVAAVRQTAKSPADSPKRRDAIDSSFDLNPGIISSLNGAATSREGKLVHYGRTLPTERRRRLLPDRSARGDRVSGATTGAVIIARHVPEVNTMSQLSRCSCSVVTVLLSRTHVAALL